MSEANLKSVAVLLIGGASKGTRFRPLSLEIPKPLFPVGGMPMLEHHVAACARVKGMREIFILGFFPDEDWSYISSDFSNTYKMKITYLKEKKECGTGGGLLQYKDSILKDSPSHIYILHCDICSDFPLQSLQTYHDEKKAMITVLGYNVSREESLKYGAIVRDEVSGELVHYREKPETFVSDLINCGIYCLSPSFFDELLNFKEANSTPPEHPILVTSTFDLLHIEDVLVQMAGKGNAKAFVFVDSDGFWEQIKTAGSSIKASGMYLQHYRQFKNEMLAKQAENGPKIVGEVYIHPNAEIHPTAKIGPNVTVGSGARIGKGVRIANSIILESVEVKDHACVLYSILGWHSVVGAWCRIEGVPNYEHEASEEGEKITIFGVDVMVDPEMIVRNSIILPHKKISENTLNRILL